jgi:NTP pyrophosphatase (non-canonical NTP hydrolase)
MDSLAEAMRKIRAFCEERDWDQFHDPKELAIGLSTEANELLDLFRFKREADMANMMNDPIKREQISQELADIFFFLIRFAQLYQFDLSESLERKMQINAIKYPVEHARGSNRKYDEK